MDSSEALSRLNPISGMTVMEDTVSGLIQGIGFLLGLGGVAVLIVRAALIGDPWIIVGVSIYGGTLLMLYCCSCLYHSVQRLPLKRGLKIIDHMAIYLLIAGTYTPFTLGPLRGPVGWTLFGLVWGMAVLGILWKTLGNRESQRISVIFYLAMGWVFLVAVVPIVRIAPTETLLLTLAGGFAYSLGVIFFVMERLPFNQAVWHMFVMGGSTCFYFSILLFVVPGV